MTIEHWPESNEFIRELLKEKEHGSDRALVLVGVTMLDILLQRLLRMSMIDHADDKEMFTGDGAPLGAFSQKIKVAFSFGLLTKIERECIDTLRKMRNDMAHQLGATLSSNIMRDRMTSIHQKAYQKSPDTTSDGRTIFIITCSGMIIALMSRLKTVKHANKPTTGFGL